MRQHLDLLRALPKVRRDVGARAADKSPEVVEIAKQYGAEYFDGDRKYGYGGYRYDGRWQPVAFDITNHYGRGLKILDVGCAKGFLVHDLRFYGEAFGLDISRYAVIERPYPEVVGRLHLGTADDLPFPDKSFDLVLSINTLHNLPRARLIRALQEMRRVARDHMFVQVDAYRTAEEWALFQDWVLTAECYGSPEGWLDLFTEAGYDGDYSWTIVEA